MAEPIASSRRGYFVPPARSSVCAILDPLAKPFVPVQMVGQPCFFVASCCCLESTQAEVLTALSSVASSAASPPSKVSGSIHTKKAETGR